MGLFCVKKLSSVIKVDKINKNINSILPQEKSDLCQKYIYKIKNMEILNDKMIEEIRDISNDEKLEIILAYNEILIYITSIM